MSELGDQLAERVRKLRGQSEPDTVDVDELLSRRGSLKAEGTPITKGDALATGFTDTGISNTLNTPAVTGNILAEGQAFTPALMNAGFHGVKNVLQGEPADFTGEFTKSREKMLNTFPISAMANIPRMPKGVPTELSALNRATELTLPEAGLTPEEFSAQFTNKGFGQRMAEGRVSEVAKRKQIEELYPGYFTSGEVGADVATVLSARGPMAGPRAANAAANRARIVKKAKLDFDQLDVPPGVRHKLEDFFSSEIVPTFKNTIDNLASAGIKAGETGFEAAFLAALHENDPNTAFGLAAGAQVAGSASLFLGTLVGRHIPMALVTAWTASEIMKAAGPGDQAFFESKDFAVHKVVGALALGAMASLSGAGRIRGPMAEKLPILLDSLTAIPRTVLTSRIQDIFAANEAGNTTPQQVMTVMASNPKAFNRNQTNSLSRAMVSEKRNAFVKEVDRLMEESEDFRNRIWAMQAGVKPPPVSGAEQMLRDTPTQPIQRN